VAELDSGGNLLGTATSAANSELGTARYRIAYDPAANVAYVTGRRWPGISVTRLYGLTEGHCSTVPYYESMFTMQVSVGSALGWVGFYSSSGGPSYGSGITVDGSSNIYVAGSDDYVTAVWRSPARVPSLGVRNQVSNNSLQSAFPSVATMAAMCTSPLHL